MRGEDLPLPDSQHRQLSELQAAEYRRLCRGETAGVFIFLLSEDSRSPAGLHLTVRLVWGARLMTGGQRTRLSADRGSTRQPRLQEDAGVVKKAADHFQIYLSTWYEANVLNTLILSIYSIQFWKIFISFIQPGLDRRNLTTFYRLDLYIIQTFTFSIKEIRLFNPVRYPFSPEPRLILQDSVLAVLAKSIIQMFAWLSSLTKSRDDPIMSCSLKNDEFLQRKPISLSLFKYWF